MRVWITRTQPGADRLAKVLAQRGWRVFTEPVLRIEGAPSPAPTGRFDWVLFVSEHAVAEAVNNGCLQASWRDCPSAAIGSAAHNLLRCHGFVPGMAPATSSAEVMQRLRHPPERTLIVKGEGGSEALQRWLRAAGGEVVEWNVYRRRPLAPAIAGEAIDAIAIGSGEGLQVVGRLWFGARRDATVPLLVPSRRVHDLAARLGFRNVVVTLGANPDVVAEALDALPKSKEHCRRNA